MSMTDKFLQFCHDIAIPPEIQGEWMHLLLECIRLGEIKTIKVEGCEYEVNADILEGNG